MKHSFDYHFHCLGDSDPKWNLKKVDWDKYFSLTNRLLISEKLDFSNPYKSNDSILEAIRVCAQESIPRRKIKRYRPFWTDEFSALKISCDEALLKADLLESTSNNVAF
ncbi:uncharacterized protein CDAR_601951 [Caerostris darwini]|uniref:Uncharacterized protein n=1 Tax=Caerostris darwini TaxID=1538125 RepID=A0AAV4V1Y6_9ARAC|nr:uncharacterized protein CDAR_601951 [Caerostris darwini]